MPGIAGGIGPSINQLIRLQQEFKAIWNNAESLVTENALLTAHSFSVKPALYRTRQGWQVGLDGEFALYHHAASFFESGEPLLFQIDEGRPHLAHHCKGNCAIILPGENTLYLATEETGSFPLYFARSGTGILFSSYLRPLARAIGAEPDPAGLIQFMHRGYSNGGRSYFRGIERLQPGQGIVYKLDTNQLRVFEASIAWTRLLDPKDENELPDRLWEELSNAIDRCLVDKDSHAIMSSGGWDSRLLVAAVASKKRNADLIGYFHGHRESREYSITKNVLDSTKTELRVEPEHPAAYMPDHLQLNFPRVESVQFPNWLRAGTLLAEAGICSVSTGLLGEIPGGLFSPAQMTQGWRRMLHVGSHLLSIDRYVPKLCGADLTDIGSFLERMRIQKLPKPWYIKRDYWESLVPVHLEINADLESDVKRIARRGIPTLDQLIEAYLAETRNCQLMMRQLLSCRNALDVANVFGDPGVYELVSSIPYSHKVVNKLMQATLRRHAPSLLKFSTAATFVPASAPMLLQEGTRVVRRLYEGLAFDLKLRSKGRIHGISSGWVDFDFMRDGRILRAVTDSIRSDFIDKDGIFRMIGEIERFEYRQELWPATHSILRVVTADLMLL